MKVYFLMMAPEHFIITFDDGKVFKYFNRIEWETQGGE